MNRLPRVAALAVLPVLLCCLHALGAMVPSARLDISRVFNPQSESLLGTLLAPPRDMSPLFVAVFNVAIPSDLASRDVAKLVPAFAPRVDVARTVNVTGISPMRTFTAPPAVAYTVPAPKPAAPIAAGSHTETVDTGAPAVMKPEISNVPRVHFGTYTAYTPALQAMSAKADIPVRVGGVRFSGTVSGEQSQISRTDALRAMQLCGTTDEGSACPYLHDSSSSSFVAGTNFNVRTGNRNVNLQLAGGVEHLSNSDAAIFPYVPMDPEEAFDASRLSSTAPGNTLLYYPGVSDLVKHNLNASVAVPITQRVTLGLQYDTAHYQGDYGSPVAQGLIQGVDARKDTYLGNVTYQLQNSSAITLSTRLYRYQDGLAPNFNLTQTRTDLNFTVKF
jgi:hypothetical protein